MEYLVYFYVYSFLGWCLEVVYQGLKKGRFINRGFLLGPWCPIYGIGASFIIEGSKDFNSTLEVFIMTLFVASFIELIAGILLNLIFHQRWWDYSEYPLNIGGYICPLFSIAWGICGVLVVKIIHPPIDIFYEYIPDLLLYILLLTISLFFIADLVLTVLNLLKINRHIKEIDEMSASLRKISDQIGKHVYEESREALQSKWARRAKFDLGELKALKESGFSKDELERIKRRKIKEAGYLEKRLMMQFENARSTKYKEAFEDLKRKIREGRK